MHRNGWIILMFPLLLLACNSRKGKLHIEGEFQNLDQADFLVYSPDGGLETLDTFHLNKGLFEKDIDLKGGPYTFTLIYPNFSTLSFMASEGGRVTIIGDALALANVQVHGADSVLTDTPTKEEPKLKVGSRLPRTGVLERYYPKEGYLLIGFWANWKGGTSVVNYYIQRALVEHSDKLCGLSFSLDVDETLRAAGEAQNRPSWETYCSYRGWDDPVVHKLELNNIPLLLLVDNKGVIKAMGTDYGRDIAPTLEQK